MAIGTPFLLLAGPYLNHLTRTASAPSMTPSAQTLFPSFYLHDNRASKAAMYALATSDSTITIDLNMVRGTFESTDDSDAWTVQGVGLIAPDGSNPYSTSSVQAGLLDIDGGASPPEAYATADIIVKAGEELSFFGAVANVDGFGTSHIAIRNRQTGHWLSTAASWGSTETYLAASTAMTYAAVGFTFNVEPLTVCITDTVTLRIYLGTSGTNGYFDDIALWPSTNWWSIHGHNIPPAIVPQIQYSTDYGGTWNTYTTMTLRRDSFRNTFSSMETWKDWRLFLSGKPDTGSLMYIGEFVVGQSFELLHNPNYGGTLKWVDQQTRQTSDLGEDFISLHNVAPQRSLSFSFTFPSTSEYHQAHKQLFRGSRGGANLICIAPLAMDDEVTVLGRIRDSFEVALNTPLERTGVLEIVELPLPNAPEIVSAFDLPVPDNS